MEENITLYTNILSVLYNEEGKVYIFFLSRQMFDTKNVIKYYNGVKSSFFFFFKLTNQTQMKTHKTVTTEFSPSSLYRELYTHRTSAHKFKEENHK